MRKYGDPPGGGPRYRPCRGRSPSGHGASSAADGNSGPRGSRRGGGAVHPRAAARRGSDLAAGSLRPGRRSAAATRTSTWSRTRSSRARCAPLLEETGSSRSGCSTPRTAPGGCSTTAPAGGKWTCSSTPSRCRTRSTSARRLEAEPETLAAAELLLTKLQIAEVNRKDLSDTAMLLWDHQPAGRRPGTAQPHRGDRPVRGRLGTVHHRDRQPGGMRRTCSAELVAPRPTGSGSPAGSRRLGRGLDSRAQAMSLAGAGQGGPPETLVRATRGGHPVTHAGLLRHRHPRLGGVLAEVPERGQFYGVNTLIMGGDVVGQGGGSGGGPPRAGAFWSAS